MCNTRMRLLGRGEDADQCKKGRGEGKKTIEGQPPNAIEGRMHMARARKCRSHRFRLVRVTSRWIFEFSITARALPPTHAFPVLLLALQKPVMHSNVSCPVNVPHHDVEALSAFTRDPPLPSRAVGPCIPIPHPEW
jgi:hypothetical protein